MLTVALAIAMFPVVSLIGPLFDMWRTLGLFDTWPGLIIPYMSFTLPLAIWTLTAFFREIPWEMEQAAQVDGATSWQAFRKVIAPLAAPGVFTAAILTLFFAWNDFVLGISLTSTTNARPVPAQSPSSSARSCTFTTSSSSTPCWHSRLRAKRPRAHRLPSTSFRSSP